jgi:predicted ribosome quality control (RQC) complex YloA/Tae2 family protein
VPGGVASAPVPDPWVAGRQIEIALDPRLTAAGNADRLFARARRLDRARVQVAARLADTRRDLEAARASEARALAAWDFSELEGRAEAEERAGPASATRHYLTTRGLSVLVGRGARENHRLTFEIARPEDLWLHARDVPGAHVIVRDNEGRAGPEDIREAAEVAAFCSDARLDARVDVHVTRRKHVRAAKGGAGRVHVFHSDTMRVAPRDPEGRLRRR